MADEHAPAWERLCELIWGCAIGQAIHACVELGIPELLTPGPRTTDQLAAATGADAWTLESVLRALAAFDVLADEGETYALTQIGRLLLKSAPGPGAGEAGPFFETIYRPLGALLEAVRTGGIAFDRVYGKSFYSYLAEHPPLAAHFFDAMESNAPHRYAGLSSIFDFSDVSRVIDVGGGEGSLLVQLLSEQPHLTGVLFDLPVAADRARARLESAGLSGRCTIVSGDFRTGVPSGGDLYILAQILNNWRDAGARCILANCRAAMSAESRLLVLEPVSGMRPPSRWQALVSLGVLAQRGGRTRSEAQLRSLMTQVGFRMESLVQFSSTTTCAITATPD